MDTPSCFSVVFTKGNYSCDLLFCSLDKGALPKKCSLHLILLHSKRPKLYAILAFLSAIGLNKKKCLLPEELILSTKSLPNKREHKTKKTVELLPLKV